MKQLIQNMRDGKTVIEEIPIPTPKPGTALVQTQASLVSAGTERMVVEFAEKNLLEKARSRPDLVKQVLDKARKEGVLSTIKAVFSRLDQPMALGYSSAGIIVALGEGMGDFQVGQRVACAGGNYAVHAEYALVPKMLITPLPDEVDFDAAAFTTLGAIAMQGFRLADARLGESVAVIGLGLLGLLTVEIAKAAGCQVFGVDISPERVALAKKLGIRAVQRDEAEEAGLAFTHHLGFDSVVICADTSSNDPVTLAGILAHKKAKVIATGAVGQELPRRIYYAKELTFINSCSYGPGRYDSSYEEEGQDYPIGYVRWTEGRNMQAVVDLLAKNQINTQLLITHRFPIEKAPDAYELITGKSQGAFLGVLLTYSKADNQPIQKKVFMSQASHKAAAKVHLGVLGAGNFATAVMLPVVSSIPELALKGIASAAGMNATHAARKFGFEYATSNENEIIEDEGINTVAVLTRHSLHARQVLHSLNSGKNVFCEKPLAISEEELIDIEGKLQEEKTPLLMVGFNRRFAPLAEKMKEFLNQSQEPFIAHYRVNAGYLPKDHWTQNPLDGGGRLIGEGCHFVDFLTYLAGDVPELVSYAGMPDEGIYNQDNFVLTMKFPDGSLGTVTYLANGDKSYPKERVEVFSGSRIAILDDFRSLETSYRGKRKTVKSPLGQDKGHKQAWQEFCSAINKGEGAPIPYDQLVGVTRLTIEAAAKMNH
ncbi:MAG: bi-domain-containing oxidoreductase [Anaerolineales bacterium]|nr:bi-domain-containing oxidoreductase [Anaerolineales bacterium]